MLNFLQEIEPSIEAIEYIVQGMKMIADLDGFDPREEFLIKEFFELCCEDVSCDKTFDEVLKKKFDIDKAIKVLNTKELKEIFFKSCYLVAYADGDFTDNENNTINNLITKFDISPVERDRIHKEVKKFIISEFKDIVIFKEHVIKLSADMGLTEEEVEEIMEKS